MTLKNKIQQFVFEDNMPIYIPKDRRFSDKLHLAIWNCGMRPQTFIQAFKDTRITIRKNNNPILVIKKGDV